MTQTERNQPSGVHSRPGDSRWRDLSGQGKTRPSKAHSLPGGGRGRNLSGNRKKPTDRGTLTNWRWQREELVRTQKETDRPRHTYGLETTEAEGGMYQNTERNRPREAHSLSGDGRGKDFSGHGKKPPEQGILTTCRQQREGLVRTQKEQTGQGALTLWRRQREGLVRAWKEAD